MQTGMFTTSKLIQALKQLQSNQLTGKLVLKGVKPLSEIWCIYFHLGRIVWATGGQHQMRRWLRSLKHHCPHLLDEEWTEKAAILASQRTSEDGEGNAWTMRVIVHALQRKAINLTQAKTLVQNQVLEVLFGVVNQFCLQSRWIPMKDIPQSFTWLYIDPVIQDAMTQSAQWSQLFAEQRRNLPSGFSPDFAIVVENTDLLKSRVSESVYQTLTTLLNGQNTFWDVASALKKPLITVANSLLPLIQDQVISLQAVPDQALPVVSLPPKALQLATALPQHLATPTSATPTSATPTSATLPSKGLIACVDDSPLVGEELESILKPLGYEILNVLDPLQGVSTLLRHKPKLIFLDLIMPNTNGYELCTFLRKSAVFRDTPIVMLTGRDGVFDRLRAKMAGSNDFLSKPPEAAKVVQVVQKFLGDELLAEQNRPADSSPREQWTLAQEMG